MTPSLSSVFRQGSTARIPKLFQELCNITIVGGQDRLRGKVFRLAHGLRRYL